MLKNTEKTENIISGAVIGGMIGVPLVGIISSFIKKISHTDNMIYAYILGGLGGGLIGGLCGAFTNKKQHNNQEINSDDMFSSTETKITDKAHINNKNFGDIVLSARQEQLSQSGHSI